MGASFSSSGVLLDLSGVLYEGNHAIEGAARALGRLADSGLAVAFVTNVTRQSRSSLVSKLAAMGLDLSIGTVFTAPLAARAYLEAHSLVPYLIVHPALEADFEGLGHASPNAVVIGDAGEAFSYERLNHAFRLVMEGAPMLALGRTRYFREAHGLSLDAGPFVVALEFATGRDALVLGKPAPAFFHAAVESIGCAPEEVVMVGDDACSDVLAALDAGLAGMLVRTGKFRSGDEVEVQRRGGEVVDDIAAAVDRILSS